MAGRPAKSVEVLKLEGKSHRTKQELAIRKAAEEASMTGKKITETKDIKEDPVAHQEFVRVRKLLKLIGKDDEIYGAAVRRYCLNKSKLASVDAEVIHLKDELVELKDSRSGFKDNIAEYYRLTTKMEDTITKKEQLAKSYRLEMIDFEKENCMTIKSALRAIPKKPETKTNALKDLLADD